MSDARILPLDLIGEVDRYAESELADFRKCSNREPFDSSGCYTLHDLAARIYAAGWRDGERAEYQRQWGERARQRSLASSPELKETPK